MKVLLVLLALFLPIADLFPAPQAQTSLRLRTREREAIYKTLNPDYQHFYDLISYIATDHEKDIFLMLDNDRDRQAYINIFWNQRDPTKGTPENEFKEEHLRRFEYANYYFRHGSPMPGWKTDRGRIHIILGPPLSREAIDSKELYPVEIWDYHGGGDTGLPPAFRVVFYKKWGHGDFQLYVPGVDTPDLLLVKEIAQIDIADYEAVYSRIHNINPTVAEASLTLLPGDRSYGLRPSPQSPLIISSIMDFPKRRLNLSYATSFLRYKGLVTVEDSTDFINSRKTTFLYYHPALDLHLLHFAVLPERLSVDYSPERDKYYFNYKLAVSIKRGEETFYQYNKTYPFYHSENELQTTLAGGLIIADFMPVIPGEWDLMILLQNSVNNEFTFFEERISVPPRKKDHPVIWGPLLAQELERDPQVAMFPFHFIDTKIKITCENLFGRQEKPNVFFAVSTEDENAGLSVKIEVQSHPGTGDFSRSQSIQLPTGKNYHQMHVPLETLEPGIYRLNLQLMNNGAEILAEKNLDFTISTLAVIPRPPAAFGTVPPRNVFALYAVAAGQHERAGETETALRLYEKALQMSPRAPELLKTFAAFLLQNKKPQRALEIIQPLQENQETLFDYHAIRGKALLGQERPREAITSLIRANEIYNSDITVLNSLGLAFMQTGQADEARRAFAASLRLDGNQAEIKKILAELDRKESEKPKKE